MKNWNLFNTTLMLALFAGATAGTISSIMVDRSMESYKAALEAGKEIVVISEEKPIPLPGTYEEALNRVLDVSKPSVASFRVPSKDAVLVNDWMNRNDVIGLGVVITSDGWILFHSNVFANYDVHNGELWIDGNRYEATDIIEDSLTDTVLVHVNASGLRAAAFGSTEMVHSGEMVFGVTPWSSVYSSYIVDSDYEEDINPKLSAEFGDKWLLMNHMYENLPVFNAAGELAGIYDADGTVLPFHHIAPFIQTAFRDKGVSHAYIGAYVSDISSIQNMSHDLVGDIEHGSLIIASNMNTALVRGSKAEEVGLKAGDIILSVDDVFITESIDLAELLVEYDVGDSVSLHLLRGGEFVDVTIELEEYKK